MNKKTKGNIIDLDDFQIIWKLFFKSWYWFFILPVIFFIGSYIYVHRLPDIFGAKTQMLLQSQDTYDVTTSFSSANYYAAYQDLSNQQRVLKSYDLVQRTLSKLDFTVSYFVVGRLKKEELFRTAPFEVKVRSLLGSLYNKPFEFKVLSRDSFLLKYKKGEKQIEKTMPFNKEITDPDFFITVNKKASFESNSLNQLQEANYEFIVFRLSHLVSKYLSSMQVNNIEFTSIVDISINDQDVNRARMFLDTLCTEYQNYTLETQYKINNNTINFIDKQLEYVSGLLRGAELDLDSVQEDRGVLEMYKENNEYLSNVVGLDDRREKLNLQLETIDKLEDYIFNLGDERLLPPSLFVLNEDDFLKRSLQELYNLQREKASTLFDAKAKNLGIDRINSEIDEMKRIILKYLQNTKEAISSEVRSTSSRITYYENEIKSIPRTQREKLDIERRRDINERMYEYLLEKRQSTIIAKASIVSRTKVIEKARSMGIVAPNKSKIMLMAAGVGVLLAFLIGFIQVVLFARIENVAELVSITDLPVLGGLPKFADGTGGYLVVNDNPKAAITESFRGVRTNLKYLSAETKSKVILVTSLHPGEGKTFCSTNLSAILAKADKKVLILDFDLHKPKMHKSLNLDRSSGISTLLVSEEITFDQVAQKTSVENLMAISSGPIPPNASELVLSQKVADLINDLKTQFDYIIIDTPPLGLISDAMVLMDHADIGIFVMNSKFASKQGVAYLEEIVEKSALKSHGIVLNAVATKKYRYYYGKYGYGYGYGYGYNYGYGYGYGQNNPYTTDEAET